MTGIPIQADLRPAWANLRPARAALYATVTYAPTYVLCRDMHHAEICADILLGGP